MTLIQEPDVRPGFSKKHGASRRPDAEPWAAILRRVAHNGRQAAAVPTGHSALLDRAYEEFCDRRAAGEALDAHEYCAGFPEIRSTLGRLLAADWLLEQFPELLQPKEPRQPERWPEPGETVAGFRLLSQLGSGSFARVFLAEQPELGNRAVVVKLSCDGAAEAHTLGRLRHANVVPVYSVREDRAVGVTVVCMPYLGHATLQHVVNYRKAHSTPPASAEVIHRIATEGDQAADRPATGAAVGSYEDGVRQIALQLAEALEFIHARQICHRDLKPSNVLLTPDCQAMLLDFNLCADPAANVASFGGTLAYMPPEQLMLLGKHRAADPASLDARSDLFSLGVILYQLLTGKHPFGLASEPELSRESLQSLLAKQRRGATPICRLNPRVDAGLARLVERCLAYCPQDRPQLASELVSALRRRPSPLGRARRCAGQHPALAAAAVFMVLALAGAATAWWTQQETETERHWRLGRDAYQQHRYEAAVKHFNRLIELEPNRADFLFARARAFQQWGETDADQFGLAVQDYSRAEKLQPDARNQACLGYCLVRMGQTEWGRTFLEEAAKMKFDSAENFNNLAFCYLRKTTELPEALKHLDKALAADPNLQAAYHNRALARLLTITAQGGINPPLKKGITPANQKLQNEYLDALSLAKADLTEAIKLGPPTRELFLNAARVWAISSAYEGKDLDQALDYLEVALNQGWPSSEMVNDKAFKLIKDNNRFQALVARSQVAGQSDPPTLRLVDPVRD